MPRLKTSSGQFGLIGGICRASSDCILIKEPAPSSPTSRRKGSLYIVADPTAEAGRSYQAARQVTGEIAKTYYECTSPSITTCLARSIRQANESLFRHNMQVSGQEKVTFGITCAVARGQELYLAQVLPGQAYIVHQGQIQSIPLNPSWDPEAATLPVTTRLLALGWSEEVNIEFFHSTLNVGDVFCLCSNNIGRFLGKGDVENALLYQEPGDIIEQIYRRIHQHGFKEGHAIVVEAQPLLGHDAASVFSLAGLQERARLAGEVVAAWGAGLFAEVRRFFQRPRKPRPPKPKLQPRPQPSAEETPEIADLIRPKPQGPWWKTLQQQFMALVRPKAGLPRLERPRMRIKATKERRFPLRFVLIAVAALITLGTFIGLVYQQAEKRKDNEVETLIQQAQDKVAEAGLTTDPANANRILDEANQLLEQALDTGRANPRVELEMAHVREERDRINGVSRFQKLDLVLDIATFSNTLSLDFAGACGQNCSLRDLAIIGDSLYLLEEEKGTIYLYNPATNAINPAFWEGKEVAGHIAAPARAIVRLEMPKDCVSGAEISEWLAVIDANRWLYLHHQGEWEAYALFSESDWGDRVIDLEGYLGNIYVLKGQLDQILKYYCNAYELAPASWVEDPRHLQMEKAVDMAIDGHIYVLLEDGKVLDLLQGELDRTLAYEVYPKTLLPVQVVTDEQTEYIYVVDRYATGRIVQLRKEGEGPSFVRELRDPNDELWDLRAMAVREAQGLFYIVAGQGLYRGIISGPVSAPAPIPSPLPSPTPDG